MIEFHSRYPNKRIRIRKLFGNAFVAGIVAQYWFYWDKEQ